MMDTIDETLPPRFWWLKRLSLAFALLLLFTLGLRLYWGYHWQNELDQRIAAIQAKGEPILFEDIHIERVPDADNKFYWANEAFVNWPKVEQRTEVVDETRDDELSGHAAIPSNQVLVTASDWFMQENPKVGDDLDPVKDQAAYLARVQENLKRLDKADQASTTSANQTVSRPLIKLLLPSLGDYRAQTRLIVDASKRARHIEKDHQALTLLARINTIKETIGYEPYTLIQALVDISISSLMRAELRDSLFDLDIQPNDGDDPVRLELVKHLDSLFRNSKQTRQQMQRAMITERMACHDMVLYLIQHPNSASQLLGSAPTTSGFSMTTWLLEPLFLRDSASLMDVHGLQVDSINENRTYRQSADYFNANHKGFDFNGRTGHMYHPFSTILLPSYGVARRTMYASITDDVLTATAIAIRLYQVDHGKLPESLDALVPAYLAAIPVDPMSSNGEPIRYAPGGGTWLPEAEAYDYENGQVSPGAAKPGAPAVVYSVGSDGIDQGGLMFQTYDGTYSDLYRNRAGDIWVLLEPIESGEESSDDQDELQ